jgi:hypothetical protein
VTVGDMTGHAKAASEIADAVALMGYVLSSVVGGVLVMLLVILCFLRKEAVWRLVVTLLRSLSSFLRRP